MFCSKPGPSSAGSSGFLVPVCAVGRGGPHPLPGGLWSSGRKGGGSAGPTSAVSLASAPRPRLRLEAQPYAPGEKFPSQRAISGSQGYRQKGSYLKRQWSQAWSWASGTDCSPGAPHGSQPSWAGGVGQLCRLQDVKVGTEVRKKNKRLRGQNTPSSAEAMCTSLLLGFLWVH